MHFKLEWAVFSFLFLPLVVFLYFELFTLASKKYDCKCCQRKSQTSIQTSTRHPSRHASTSSSTSPRASEGPQPPSNPPSPILSRAVQNNSEDVELIQELISENERLLSENTDLSSTMELNSERIAQLGIVCKEQQRHTASLNDLLHKRTLEFQKSMSLQKKIVRTTRRQNDEIRKTCLSPDESEALRAENDRLSNHIQALIEERDIARQERNTLTKENSLSHKKYLLIISLLLALLAYSLCLNLKNR